MTRIAALCFLLLTACSSEKPAGALDGAFLQSNEPMPLPVPTIAFEPPAQAKPSNHFEGVLSIEPTRGRGRMKVLTDWFEYAEDPDLELTKLPDFSFEFVLDGNDLIPVRRGPQGSNHPHWEFILEPGKAWDDPDLPGWSRASLPFALQERNANCTHNGLMTFLYRADGSTSRLAYQVGSETCQYFQADLWGVLPAEYIPREVESAGAVIDAFHAETAARLPVKPMAEITEDYPEIDPHDFEWYPAAEVSAMGFVIDGTHYRGACHTRFGPYPFCDVLDLPSYSLAKSIFAGLALMILEQEQAGTAGLPVAAHVPECSGPRWAGVTLEHLLDMSSGNFESIEANADEYASYETEFMSGDTHVQKITTACGLFPRRAPPGSTFAYHTSDTYIAGTMMNNLLAQESDPDRTKPRDIHRDVLWKQLFEPLGLSPVLAHTRRSYDETAQPFAGYGLTLHSDDIARLGLFLARGDGIVNGRQVLNPQLLRAALQRDPSDPGLQAGSAQLRYNNGFWAFETSLENQCREPVWIPFMSGYGGISVAILPNRSVYYVFSDHGRFEWLNAAVSSSKIKNICE